MNVIRDVNRRAFVSGIAGTALAFAAPNFAAAQSLTRVRVGYLHTLTVDGHMWIAQHLGAFEKFGLVIEPREFTTGVELFQALVGGSLDIVSCGAVLSNFPARGQGKAFLLNNLETSLGQVWVNGNVGINSIEDLKGKKIATTRGTTAHICLHEGLKSVGLDSAKDVEIVNQRMSDAVTAFIAGAVPACALWVPYNTSVRDRLPNARKLFDSTDYEKAWVADGWAARNDFHTNQRDVLKRFIRAWAVANDMAVNKVHESLDFLHENHYSMLSRNDVQEMRDAARYYDLEKWARLYRDGTVAGWLDQVTRFNVEVGAIENPLSASDYFDPTLLVEVASERP
jgi:NitT/TauT family transport system substrate-binding protein